MIDFGSSDSDFVEEVPTRSLKGRRSTVSSLLGADEVEEPLDLPPGYLVELARSGRAECKRCSSVIANKELRVGVIVEGDWGIMTRWQHLRCTVFHKSLMDATTLDGFAELDPADQIIVTTRVNQSLNEMDEDDVPVDPNELVRTAWVEEMEPPADLLLPLLPYQKEGLGWMVSQELNSIHGGILADEMGMGKTIQAISLILANKPDPGSNEQLIEWKLSDEKHGFGGSPAVSRGKTLIVVPTIALRQWRSEIHRFSKEGSLKVVIYHGENREAEANNLREADVVLTTYKIIEIEHRKATAGTKIECSICGKKFYPEKLRIHRKYFCGDDAERTEAQARTISNGRRRPLSAAVSSYNERDSGSEDSISRQKRSNKKSAQTAPTATASSKRINQNRPSSIKCPDSSDDEISRQKKVNKQAAAKAAKGASAPNVRQAKKSPKDSVSESSGDEIIPQKKSNKKVDTATKKTKFVAKKVNSTDVINQKTPARNTEKSKTQSPSSSRRSERVAVSTSNKPPPRYVYDSEEIVTEFDSEDSCSKAASSSDESSSEASSESAVEKPVIKRRKVAIASSAKQKTEGKAAPDPKPSTQIGSEEVEQEIRRALLKHARDNKNRAPKVSVLHNISWFRIILDEAHLIKDRSTSTAHASFALVSLNKWCLTGTPLQNRVGELYSLVRFLRLDPHAFYYCRTKGCSCKSLHYKFTQGRCDDCNHTAMQHFCHFNKHILNPIKRAGYVSEGRRAMMKLKDQILDAILLRRTKLDRADDIMLPARFVSVRQEFMDEREADFYEALYTQSKAQFNTYVQSGTVLNNYAHIFDILIRLRQAVDHPYLVIYSDTIKDYGNNSASRVATPDDVANRYRAFDGTDTAGIAPAEKALSCALCHEPPDDPRKSKCGHVFCRLCALELIDTSVMSTAADAAMSGKRQHTSTSGVCLCPQCDKPLTIASIGEEDVVDSTAAIEFKSRKASIMSKIDKGKFQSSSKLEALMQELHTMSTNDPGAKALVFSQFVNMLDLISFRLHLEGISCSKLLGYMTVDNRDEALKRFNEDPSVKVLLISLKTGGVALNLTVANYIFLMDPWWNPAAEMQAIDRAHRIGQNKPIFATRFIIKDSIEERILQLQSKKQLVFEGTVGGDASSMARLTVDDMRFLFH